MPWLVDTSGKYINRMVKIETALDVSLSGFRLHLNELLGIREDGVRLHVTITGYGNR